MRPILIFAFATLCSFAMAQEIALTFDDAPPAAGALYTGEERTERIIEALAKNNVSEAAFFVLTGGINDKTSKRLMRYTEAGHILANHSNRHLWIHQAGTSAYIQDIAIADSILKKLPGYTKWYRYPYLDEGRTAGARDSIRAALDSLQLSNGYVTVDNYDWYLNSLLTAALSEKRNIRMEELRTVYIDHIYNSILFYDGIAMKHLGRSPKHVLLLHENDVAALFLGDLIVYLKSKGWKIISPRIAYQDDIATRIPDVLFNGQGRVAPIAREQGVPAHELVQDAEDEAYLDELVKTRSVFK